MSLKYKCNSCGALFESRIDAALCHPDIVLVYEDVAKQDEWDGGVKVWDIVPSKGTGAQTSSARLAKSWQEIPLDTRDRIG